jgi:hypothetical protein
MRTFKQIEKEIVRDPRAKKRTRTLLTLLAAVTLTTDAALAQDGWTTYRNEEFGYSVTYPSNLRLSKIEEYGIRTFRRSRSIESKDGKVGIYITESHMEENQTIQDRFNTEFTEQTQGGDSINYSVIKNNWFVITGTNAKGFEFYSKFFAFAGDEETPSDWFITFDFVYPHSQHRIYDPMVAQIAHDFVPKLAGNYEH